MRKKAPGIFLLLITFAAAVLLHLPSRDYLHELNTEVPFHQRDRYLLPPASALRGLALNYATFAASMTWIQGLIYFGDWRFSLTPIPPKHLRDYADAVRILDEDFFAIYEWFDATYINSNLYQDGGVPHEVLVNSGEFLMEGHKKFSHRYELPYKAGSNFLGFSKNRKPEVRIKEYQLGIEYLDLCLKFADCPPYAAPTRARMYDQMLDLQSKASGQVVQRDAAQTEKEIENYLELLKRTQDPAIKRWLRELLLNQGVDPSKLAEQEILTERYEANETNYLPMGMWTLTESNISWDVSEAVGQDEK